MAEELTSQQRDAVINRGGKLLVSAAAGSGKTKVLVDRLMSYLMDPVDPANLDDFLIITYTKAAAAELRGKIAAKLSEKMAEDPSNRHLQRQMQRLYLAKITTVHSFCGDVLREYAYLVDLPADFRVADDNECAQIRENSMAKVLDEAYANSADADFQAFVDTQGLGRDDRDVPKILMKIYDSARCHLEPDAWLDGCINNADISGLTDAGQTIWGEYLIQDLKEYLALQISAWRWCAERAERAEMMEEPAALLRKTICQLEYLQNATTWEEVRARSAIDYGKLDFKRKTPDIELRDRIKAMRDASKASLAAKLVAFADPSEIVLEDLGKCTASVRGMVKLVRQFAQEYDRAKRLKRVLDFGDLEHKMLKLLLGKNQSGYTAAAAEIGSRFREVMVDEYQDTNAVQDSIFSALTAKKQNCFLVGDVKQSIYRFRLADPGIFLDKYNTYANVDVAVNPEGRRVMLSKNFRSGAAILEGANDVFRCCMSPKVGGLVYGDDEALVEGFKHQAIGEPEVELWTMQAKHNAYAEEARLVAQRIKELTDGTHYIREGKEKVRPIRPDDIAILLRSVKGDGQYYKDALAAVGIPCTTGDGNELLSTQEIAVLRSLLQVISNPLQDIPLVAALTNPIFCVNADELAQLRADHPYGGIYDALKASDMPKIKDFLAFLAVWRKEARLLTLAQLLESIFVHTRLDSIFGAMPDGDVRKSNLQAFYQLAVDYEKTGRRDLEQFLDHLDALEKEGLSAPGTQAAPGSVTMMTIHKSKGLEFPVVFMCALAHNISHKDVQGEVLCDKDLGLGLSAVDAKLRARYPTIAKRAISMKIMDDTVSEEMRILYVALTRAKDRMIMYYSYRYLPTKLTNLAMRMDVGDRDLLTREASCIGDWVLMAAMHRTEAGELFALGGNPLHSQPGKPAWVIRVAESPLSENEVILEQAPKAVMPLEIAEKLERGLSFRYPHSAATQAPSKQTATQRKGRQKDEETDEYTPLPVPMPRSVGKSANSGAAAGTATHAVMEHICYANCADLAGVLRELERLAEENYITQEQKEMVDAKKIAAFFTTELGRKLQSHPNVLREFKFSILDDAVHFDAALAGEEILLQGVVDCAMIEDDGITIIDFKTDYVTADTVGQKLAHYRPQVKAYADAMARIYQLPVKSAWLYFFQLNESVQV